jgi:hypothetical protein
MDFGVVFAALNALLLARVDFRLPFFRLILFFVTTEVQATTFVENEILISRTGYGDFLLWIGSIHYGVVAFSDQKA